LFQLLSEWTITANQEKSVQEALFLLSDSVEENAVSFNGVKAAWDAKDKLVLID
jgi:hypothetical protein